MRQLPRLPRGRPLSCKVLAPGLGWGLPKAWCRPSRRCAGCCCKQPGVVIAACFHAGERPRLDRRNVLRMPPIPCGSALLFTQAISNSVGAGLLAIQTLRSVRQTAPISSRASSLPQNWVLLQILHNARLRTENRHPHSAKRQWCSWMHHWPDTARPRPFRRGPLRV